MKKAKVPKFMKGKMFGLEKVDYDLYSTIQLQKIENEYDTFYDIDRGNIIPNKANNNDIIIFEINESIDYYGFSFRGFLYPGSEFIGKFIYPVNLSLPSEDFRGKYFFIGKNKLILKGIWTGADNSKNYIVINLKK